MRRKRRVIVGIVLGVLALLLILGGPAAPLLVRLGVKPVCIQGSFPRLRFVACPQPATGQPAATLLPTADLVGQTPSPIIVDDDGSPDGIIALLYLLRDPAFDVRAVTVSSGEAHPDLFVHHVTRLLAELGRPDIPVGVGRAAPLEGDNAFPDPWRESSDIFWGISLPESSSSNEALPAAQLIVETLSNSSMPVALFVSGTHTNLAEALRLDPGIVGRIRDVYVMGGSIYGPGNIESDWPSIHNTVAEWNIWVDPQAAWEVFASGLRLHITPLDATNRVTWTESDALEWAASGAPEGALAGELLQWMLDSWSASGVYVWDLVAAMASADARLCAETPLHIDVLVAPGPDQGRTVVTDRAPNAAVCLDPDPDQMKARAREIFGQ